MRRTMGKTTLGLVIILTFAGCTERNGHPPVSNANAGSASDGHTNNTPDSQGSDSSLSDTESSTADVVSSAVENDNSIIWGCQPGTPQRCRDLISSAKTADLLLDPNCRCKPASKKNLRKIGTPSEERLKSWSDGIAEQRVTVVYEKTGAKVLSLEKLFALCHKGNVNCQEYYFDGILHFLPVDTLTTPMQVIVSDFPGKTDEILGMVNGTFRATKTDFPSMRMRLSNGYFTGPSIDDLFVHKHHYKYRFRKLLWKYDNELWDPFPFTNPDAPRDSTIVKGKHCLLANADQIEVFYDPDNLLKPAMRIYPEELAVEEDAKGIVWNDDAVKKSGLKSVRLIDATVAILADMEKNPYINKPAP